MRAPRILVPALVALLSLGFLGQSPSQREDNRRHISSCEDPALKPHSAALPASLFSFIQDDSARQTAIAYSLFMQAMQVNASLFSLTAPSMYGYPVPVFPSYATPVDHYVAPSTPAYSTLAWGGLMTDSRLQYLIHPTPSTSMSAAKGSLDALVDLPVIQSNATIGFSVGANITAAPVPGAKSTSSVSRL